MSRHWMARSRVPMLATRIARLPKTSTHSGLSSSVLSGSGGGSGAGGQAACARPVSDHDPAGTSLAISWPVSWAPFAVLTLAFGARISPLQPTCLVNVVAVACGRFQIRRWSLAGAERFKNEALFVIAVAVMTLISTVGCADVPACGPLSSLM